MRRINMTEKIIFNLKNCLKNKNTFSFIELNPVIKSPDIIWLRSTAFCLRSTASQLLSTIYGIKK